MRVFLRACAVASMVMATVGVPSMANADDGQREPLAQFGTTERSIDSAASRALRAVQEARTKSSGKSVHASRDYTLKLRDLRLLRDELSGTERKTADRLLARPTNRTAATDDEGWPLGSVETKTCGTTVCVHYLASGADAATSTFANTTLADAQSVLQEYVAAGFRAPESDASSDGDARLDIYLSDVGPALYGYCTSDDPKTSPSTNGYDLWAYCVLDNDYDPSQFTGNPHDLLDVTLAHELFHAVQYAYDAYEDGWMMEATATWAEDELYDAVNDNRAYLGMSPLSYPGHSLDRFEDVEDEGTYAGYQYGAWTFFRYLSERYPTKQGDLPVIIRNIWLKADGSTLNANRDADSSASIFAVRSSLAAVDSRPFRSIFAEFSARNRHPVGVYEEGSSWRQYVAAPRSTYTLSPSRRSRDWSSFNLAQLASQTIQYKPSGFASSSWKLKLSVSLPPATRGSAATALVFRKSGTVKTYPFALSSTGAGTKYVEFSSSTVDRVQLVLSNAGLHYNCWQDSNAFRSCAGLPLDNSLSVKFKAGALRD